MSQPRKPRGGGIGIIWHSNALLESGGGMLERASRRFSLSRHFGYYSKRVDRIVAVSKGVRNFLSTYCKDEDKIVVVPTGVDVSELHISFVRPQSPFVFLAFADSAEGVATILEAGSRVANHRGDFRICLSGGSEVATIVSNAFRQIPEWLDVKVDCKDYVSLYDSASCFVSADRGGVPYNIIAGASISGLPLIVSNGEATRWWSSSTPSVFQFNYPSSIDLARTMKFVMGIDREKLAQKCEISSRVNSAKYSLDSWANHIITIYREIRESK